jgi:anti-sigma regulatory factor (Ser/Thr protein kinase)
MDVLIIVQFAIWLEKNGGRFTLGVEPNLREYVESIGLLEFCNSNVNSPTTVEEISSSTAMPIKRVNLETMYSYILATEEYLKSRCPGKDLQMLQVCLSELINNVYDHSQSSIDAYVFCEFYPSSNSIILVVSDLGIGVPSAVNSYRKENGQEPLSSEECLKWAIKENSTTQSIPQNRGKGLDTLDSFIKSNHSQWQVLTGDVSMLSAPEEVTFEKNPISGFVGTIVQLFVYVSNLPDIVAEEDSEMDW